MKMYFVKVKAAIKPGMFTWKTIKAFHDFHEADKWLCNYVTENHYAMVDFTISRNH